MPKRKRRRTKIKPGPILALGIIVVFVTGILYSPLTSLSVTTVVGAHASDEGEIQGILSVLNGIPWIMVNPRWVETRVQRIEAVDHASYSQNIFGRGNLQIFYRVPVARIKANIPIGLDATGVMFKTDELSDALPVVLRPDSARDLPITAASGFPSTSVADLAQKAQALAPQGKLTIWFNKEGALCLNMGTGLVILGSCDDLDEKLHALKEILDDQPGLLAKLESLNLTEPTRPVKTYKRQRE
ncbi:MAG TPA: hypothetical protein VHE55_14270 [Fimbriimonadaceae bacterium]|nr:hypothetical protein [Fimbriimonadaceae bacterium]